MEAQTLLLQRCFQEAASSSRRALELCLDETVAALQVAERGAVKLAERDEMTVAWSSLRLLRPAWGENYAAQLLAAFNAGPSSGVSPSAYGSLDGSRSGFAGLSLVDDAQVSQNIEFARLSQELQLQVDSVMADLDALTSSAQGFSNVRSELNPFRPEVFARALRSLLDGANVESGTRALWLKHLAAPMGRELKAIYERLIALLRAANVRAVTYRAVPPASGGSGAGTSSSVGAGRGHAGESGGAAGFPGGAGAEADAPHAIPQASYADPLQLDVGETLFQDFLVHGDVDSQVRLADSYYARVDEELEALRAQARSPSGSSLAEPLSADGALPADLSGRQINGQSPLNATVWGQYAASSARKLVRAELKKEATHLRQVLGLEVVRQLVNQVAQDPRLLVPVRESIVALEPSLLRLAMVDPRFFVEETHPGRRLMERVAQRSFKYNDEDSAEFLEFFESVRRSFNALNTLKIDSGQPFNSALATLEAEWTERDRAEEASRHEVLHGLRFAEERQAMADQIAYDMSSRSDLDKVPAAVLDFLYGPWALVMAHARLVDQANQIDPRGFGTVVSDLIWSAKQDFTLRQPAKLMDMIPGLLRKLNAGLDLIGQDARERESFFEILMRLHRPVLKLRRLKSERDTLESGAIPLESDLLPATAEQRVPREASRPWLAPREQDDAGFEDTLPSTAGELQPEAGESAGEPLDTARKSGSGASDAQEAGPVSVEQTLMGLRTGCWVDLFSRRRWRRAQLVWASTKGTLFMFVSHGGRPHSMTKRSCERLINSQLLRLVESHGVVAHALDSLKKEAQAEVSSAGLTP